VLSSTALLALPFKSTCRNEKNISCGASASFILVFIGIGFQQMSSEAVAQGVPRCWLGDTSHMFG
jgi:hypothetical protein